MAKASEFSYQQLEWAWEQLCREDTLTAAGAHLVDYHHRPPLAQEWGAGRLSSSDGHPQEYGRLVKTNLVLDWLADEELRTWAGRQLNKREQLHELRRAILYANEGQVRQLTPEQQGEQALCLAIVVNAIVAWNTVYTHRVLDELRAGGDLITTTEIEDISPLAHQHIHLYGHYPFDLASRPDRHRPLRTPVAVAKATPQTRTASNA